MLRKRKTLCMEAVVVNYDYGRLLPSTIGISADKL